MQHLLSTNAQQVLLVYVLLLGAVYIGLGATVPDAYSLSCKEGKVCSDRAKFVATVLLDPGTVVQQHCSLGARLSHAVHAIWAVPCR